MATWVSWTSCSTSVSALFSGSSLCSLIQFPIHKSNQWSRCWVIGATGVNSSSTYIFSTDSCKSQVTLRGKHNCLLLLQEEIKGESHIPAHVDIFGKLLQHSLNHHLQPCKTPSFLEQLLYPKPSPETFVQILHQIPGTLIRLNLTLKLDQILSLLPNLINKLEALWIKLPLNSLMEEVAGLLQQALNHLEVKRHWIKHMPWWLHCLMCHWCCKHLPCPVSTRSNSSQHCMRHSHHPFLPLNWFHQHNTGPTLIVFSSIPKWAGFCPSIIHKSKRNKPMWSFTFSWLLLGLFLEKMCLPQTLPFLISCNNPFPVTIKNLSLRICICENTDSKLEKLYQLYDPFMKGNETMFWVSNHRSSKNLTRTWKRNLNRRGKNSPGGSRSGSWDAKRIRWETPRFACFK